MINSLGNEPIFIISFEVSAKSEPLTFKLNGFPPVAIIIFLLDITSPELRITFLSLDILALALNVFTPALIKP